MKFFKDKEFYELMVKIAVPIIIQNLIMSSLNVVDIIMIGQLGEVSIAGVGLGNQMFFLLSLFLFGVVSGAGVFTAQYWGTKDIKNIKRVLGITLITSVTASMIFGVVSFFFSKEVISLYSQDSRVIEEGGRFLKILAVSFPLSAVSFSYAFVLRSIGNVKMTMYVTMIAISINTVLNYILIFGNYGFPQMGVEGAAIGTLIARAVELLLIVYLVYNRKLPVAAKFKELFDIDIKFIKRFFITAMPVILNEFTWALGVTVYALVYARMGTESIAAINIFSTIERMAFVIFFGLTNACAIMIGNKIGEGKTDIVKAYTKRFLILSPLLGIVFSIIIALLAPILLMPFNVSESVRDMAAGVLMVFVFVMWAKIFNMVTIVGILRGGGDTKFGFIVDAGGIWLIGVPLAVFTGIILKLPLPVVYLALCTEEFVKVLVGGFRVKSWKWINNLTHDEKKTV